MPPDAPEKLRSGGPAPGLEWFRPAARLARRAAGLVVRMPLTLADSPAGRVLGTAGPLRMDGVVTAAAGAAYTVAEAKFDATAKAWATLSGGRTVTAYEYNGASGVAVGTAVRVLYTAADDWRFWIGRDGSATTGGPTPPHCRNFGMTVGIQYGSATIEIPPFGSCQASLTLSVGSVPVGVTLNTNGPQVANDFPCDRIVANTPTYRFAIVVLALDNFGNIVASYAHSGSFPCVCDTTLIFSYTCAGVITPFWVRFVGGILDDTFVPPDITFDS